MAVLACAAGGVFWLQWRCLKVPGVAQHSCCLQIRSGESWLQAPPAATLKPELLSVETTPSPHRCQSTSPVKEQMWESFHRA